MGVSTDAILAYGYDLGGAEDEWKIKETGEYGCLNLPWFDPEDDDAGFMDAVEKRLLAAAGFTETDWQVDGYFTREREALATFGVHLVSHCHVDYPMYILAAHHITSHRGWVGRVDLPALVALQEDADARLARTVEALGITPTQEPGWLLVSNWG